MSNGSRPRDKENVLAIRVYNEGDDGGISGTPIHFEIQDNPLDGVKLLTEQKTFAAESRFDVKFDNTFDCAQKGMLTAEMTNVETNAVSHISTRQVNIKGKQSKTFSFALPNENTSRLKITYKDNDTGKEIEQTLFRKEKSQRSRSRTATSSSPPCSQAPPSVPPPPASYRWSVPPTDCLITPPHVCLYGWRGTSQQNIPTAPTAAKA